MNDVRMDLFQRGLLKARSAKHGLKFGAIGENIFAGIPIHEAEIEDFLIAERACATSTHAESMDQPGEFREGGDFEDLETAGFAETPEGRETWMGGGGTRASRASGTHSLCRRGWGPFRHDSDSIIGAIGRVEIHAGLQDADASMGWRPKLRCSRKGRRASNGRTTCAPGEE